MVVFDDEKVIGLFGFDQVTGGFLLGVESVGGNDGVFQGQRSEQFGEFGDLVGLFIERDLADHHGFLMENGAEQMGSWPARVLTAAQRFAVHGHGASGQRVMACQPLAHFGIQPIGIQSLGRT